MLKQFKDTFPIIGANSFIDDSAIIIGDVIMGAECSAWFNVVIRGDVNYIRIGDRTNVQDLSMLHVTKDKYPLIIGDEVTIGHSVTVHGCRIGNRVLIGMGAIILDDAEIGDDCIVGAGALVLEHVKIPPRSLVVGSPARVIRELKDSDLEKLKKSAQNYVDYSREYMK